MKTETAGYLIRPAAMPAFPTHVQWSDGNRLLSPPECRELIARFDSERLEFGTVGTPTERRKEMETRCVQLTTMPPEEPSLDWFYDRLAQKVAWSNETYFKFTLTGLIEPAQFLKYTPAQESTPEKEGKPDGHYRWHQDFGEGSMSNRKLSVVIQLSDAADYDGSRLKLMTHYEMENPHVGQGEGIMFPSWTPHMVTPITRGVRHAIVLWVHGPRFS